MIIIGTYDELVRNNINLAYKVFWKYYPYIKDKIEFEDGVALCFEGLVKAAIKYDEDRGFTFSTFAYTVIRNHLFLNINRLSNNISTISLDSPINSNDEDCELGYFIADSFNMEEVLENKLTNELLHSFINELPTTNKQIMELYLQGLNQLEIAKYLNLSQAHVNKLFNKSINILRVKFSRKEMM